VFSELRRLERENPSLRSKEDARFRDSIGGSSCFRLFFRGRFIALKVGFDLYICFPGLCPNEILLVSNDRASSEIMGSSSSEMLLDSKLSSVSSFDFVPIDEDDDDSDTEEGIKLNSLLLALVPLDAVETLRAPVVGGDGEI